MTAADDSGVDGAEWPLVRLPPGVVLVDAEALAELRAAVLVERAFADAAGGWR